MDKPQEFSHANVEDVLKETLHDFTEKILNLEDHDIRFSIEFVNFGTTIEFHLIKYLEKNDFMRGIAYSTEAFMNMTKKEQNELIDKLENALIELINL